MLKLIKTDNPKNLNYKSKSILIKNNNFYK